MKIEKLIEELEKIKASEGNIECIIEAESLFDKKIDTTVETLRVIDFLDGKAVRFYWQMF